MNGFCHKKPMSLKSFVLVSLQVLLAVFILLNGYFIAKTILAGIFQSLGLLLGIWSVLVMNKSKLNIFPEIRKGAFLINTGPYSLIRHPMYLSILLVLTPLIIENYSILRLIALILLLLVLILKIEREERMLKMSFSDYQSYSKLTYRLIPFIY